MKGKIGKCGQLKILRNKKFKAQFCCYGQEDSAKQFAKCGDHCSQFGEPNQESAPLYRMDKTITYETVSDRILIDICQSRSLIFDEFEDERE